MLLSHPGHRVHARAWSRGWGAGRRVRPVPPAHDPCPSRCRRDCCPDVVLPDEVPGAVRRHLHRCRRGCYPAAGPRGAVRREGRAWARPRGQLGQPEPPAQQAGLMESPSAGRWPVPRGRSARPLRVRPKPLAPPPSWRWPSWPLSSWPASRLPEAKPRPGAELPGLRWWRRRNERIRPFPAIWQGRPCSRLRAP